MRIFVKAKTGVKKEKIEKISENTFVISVKEFPIDGRANEAVIKLLAKYFNVSKSQIKIITGHTNKKKIIEISC